MEIYLLCFVFSMLWKLSVSIECYKCDPERTYGNEHVLCEHFDGGARYLADCPHSSMCYKRVTTLNIGNGLTASTTQRGCALQTMSGDQKKINGRWRPVNTIYDVYSEGCAADPSDAERATTTLYCYCRGARCNRAPRTPHTPHTHSHTLALFLTTLVTALLVS